MKHIITNPYIGMKQCKLVQGNRYTISWVPEAKSSIGSENSIGGLSGVWTVVEWKL